MADNLLLRSNVGAWFAASCVALVLVGCGGGKESKTQTASATPSPQPTRTPAPTPRISGNHVSFPEKHYDTDFPAGWTVAPNQGTIAGLQIYSTDVFFAPASSTDDPATSVRANVEISCLAPDPDVTDADGLKTQWTDITDKLINHAPLLAPVTELTVSGQRAFRFEYGLDLGARKFDQVDVLFLMPDCRWLLRFVRPKNADRSLGDAFDIVLGSFTLSG